MTAIAFHHEPRARQTRSVSDARPKVSIVLAVEAARECLRDLMALLPADSGPEVRNQAVEVLVVRPGARRITEERELRHPLVRIIGTASNATRPEMRAQGLRHASGDVVVLVDEGRQFDLPYLQRLTGRMPNPSLNECEIRA